MDPATAFIKLTEREPDSDGPDGHTDGRQTETMLIAGALQSAIFNSANFSSIATDAKGVIQIFNVGAERMLGYATTEVIDKITPADISDSQELIARAQALSVEFGTPITPGFEALVFKASRRIEDIYELTYIRKDGSRFPAVVSVTALRDAGDMIIGYLLIGTDNTARKKVEEERMNLDLQLRDQHRKNLQLADASLMKSEFLANMSHELRTPLNNMLILSQLLFENNQGNLTPRQVEFARTIHSSGNDLLQLISDILDLSKIESGKMSVEISEIRFEELADHLKRTFAELANRQKLDFFVELEPNLPHTLFTDSQRLLQVLRNLLSNAFKFTERGSVTFRIEMAQSGWNPAHPVLGNLTRAVAFSVLDSGIGVSKEKQLLIFDAFRQADGSTSRKYGGTGLGLSISREIARILGGEISLKSEPGEGSIFTFYLPETCTHIQYDISEDSFARKSRMLTGEIPGGAGASLSTRTSNEEPEPLDDRLNINKNDRVLLIVDDDTRFARLLLDMARENGFKGILAFDGDSALDLLKDYRVSAIMLDIRLPDMDGWSILDRLKRDINHRHIPIQVISADDQWKKSRSMGAITHITKPMDRKSLQEAFDQINRFISRKVKMVLIVGPDEVDRQTVIQLLSDDDLETIAVASGNDALKAVKELDVDCVVLNIGLPDTSGLDVISQLRQIGPRDLPIIIYTGFAGGDVSGQHAIQLKRLAGTTGVTEITTPERLFNEISIFLHRRSAGLSLSGQAMIQQVGLPDPILRDRTVLVVDDDVRNIFALASLLEEHRMRVLFADNAREGIQILKETPDVDAVLMDIMMPEMDGYSAIREIRMLDQFTFLQIIAVTAKAMKGDRQKCLDAGASDYITKPVNIDQLLAILRIGVRDAAERAIL